LLKVDGELCQLADASTSVAPTGPYIAISYRWGVNPSHLVLTADNLAQLTQGIEYTTLPKTFRDAVVVARRLKVKYLLQSGPGHVQD
jgi:hypothetical protein